MVTTYFSKSSSGKIGILWVLQFIAKPLANGTDLAATLLKPRCDVNGAVHKDFNIISLYLSLSKGPMGHRHQLKCTSTYTFIDTIAT